MKIPSLNKILLSLTLPAAALWPRVVGAQDVCPGPEYEQPGGICLPAGAPGDGAEIDSIGELVTTIIEISLLLVGSIAVIFVIFGGFKYLTANGDEEKIKSAKKTIINAIIGLIIVLLAYSIVRIVINVISAL